LAVLVVVLVIVVWLLWSSCLKRFSS